MVGIVGWAMGEFGERSVYMKNNFVFFYYAIIVLFVFYFIKKYIFFFASYVYVGFMISIPLYYKHIHICHENPYFKM